MTEPLQKPQQLPWDKAHSGYSHYGYYHLGEGHSNAHSDKWEGGKFKENGRFVPEEKIQALHDENANLKRQVEVLSKEMRNQYFGFREIIKKSIEGRNGLQVKNMLAGIAQHYVEFNMDAKEKADAIAAKNSVSPKDEYELGK